MQNPDEDTEWNDALRKHGIIPQKQDKEITEEDIVNLLEETVEAKSQGKALSDMTYDELNENEDDIDEEDERMFEQYRRQRLAEMRQVQMSARFGEVGEITHADYVQQVNQAGDGVWVVLHVYKDGLPLCRLVDHHMRALAHKFPATKFLRSLAQVCIPNYPDHNLPTLFVYYESDLKKQWVGPLSLPGGMSLKQEELEWLLAQVGAVTSDIEKPEREHVKDVMNIAIRQSRIDNDSDSD